MNFIKNSPEITIAFITATVSILFWFAFYINLPGRIGFPSASLETIFANYDGPNYMVIAKCGYDKSCIGQNFSLPLPLEYYPAHLPGYPLIIKYFALMFSGPKAMLLATLSGSILLSLAFYKFISLYFPPGQSFWLSLVFLFLPARLFVLRQVGAPESWFLASIILSIYFFKKDNLILSALMAVLAQILKSPGVILLFSYGLIFLANKRLKDFAPYLLVPLSVLLIFLFYQYQVGDFWAYFHSGDNFHLRAPYSVFYSHLSWINTIWLEEVIYVFLLSFMAIYYLWRKFKFDIITVFPALYILASILVAHRDISRYIAPAYPFFILAFSPILNKTFFKAILFIIIPGIILYSINFILGNTAPIADWTPYLQL